MGLRDANLLISSARLLLYWGDTGGEIINQPFGLHPGIELKPPQVLGATCLSLLFGR